MQSFMPIGRAIATRRTNLSTPMPKHHDPFRQPPPPKEGPKPEESEVQEPTLARGTNKGTPAVLSQHVEPTAELQGAIETSFENPPADVEVPTPFEEPRVDEFGTGVGV